MPRPRAHLGRLSSDLPEWGPSQLVEAAIRTRERLKLLGVPIDAQARLELSRIAIERIEKFDVQFEGIGGPTEVLRAEAARTIVQQHCIVRIANGNDPSEIQLLRRIVGGSVTPTPGKEDPARAAEAELFTAAIFRAGGYDVTFAEPDIVIEDTDGRLGIAVKRVTSLKDDRYKRRVREADKQLQKQGLEGFIFVHVDQLLAAMSPRDDPSTYLYEKVSEWLDHLNLAAPSTVMGVFGYGLSFRRQGASRVFHVTFHFVPIFVAPDDEPATQARVHAYAKRLADGVHKGITAALSFS